MESPRVKSSVPVKKLIVLFCCEVQMSSFVKSKKKDKNI